MEAILSWVKSGVLFGIFASVILMLCPNKSYSKHIDFVVGIVFILVMLHPVMEFLKLDEKTYVSYIDNFLKLEGSGEELSSEQIELYEESVNIQLISTLDSNGYSVKKVEVDADERGNVTKVSLIFEELVTGLENIEIYLQNLFGQEVQIVYEYE